MSVLKKPEGSTPEALGYSMPAEWHPHTGTLLSWPVNRDTWPGSRLGRAENVYLQIIRALFEYETIHLIVHDEKTEVRVRHLFRKAGLPEEAVVYHRHPSNDVWARDFGPIFIKNKAGEFAVTDWEYNAWGGKYPPYDSDNNVPRYFADRYRIPCFSPEMVLEGGAIETNGRGVMMTTESVLLNPNRNPELTREDIENRLKEFLGQEQIIWLKDGLAGDDTDGHIDDLSRFVSEDTIVTVLSDNLNDINYRALIENYEILKASVNQSGQKFDIITLPLPETKVSVPTVDGSWHVPASYANFYIANGIVLLPLYDERYDKMITGLFTELFPGHKIAGIPCRDLVWGQGGIHCITQQLYFE